MNLQACGNYPNGPAGAQAFPVLGVMPKSTAFAVASVRNANGLMFDLSGAFTAVLPPLSGASPGSAIWVHFRKRDGSGVCTVACAGLDTFSSGAASINLYQEDVTLFSYGDVWRSPPGGRQRGWISIGTTTIASSVASLLLSTAFTDTEFSQHQIDYFGVSKASSSYVLMQVSKGGTVDTGAHYLVSGLCGAGTTTPKSNSNSSSTFFPCECGFAPNSTSSTNNAEGIIVIRNPSSATVSNQMVRVDGTAIGGSDVYSKTDGYNSTAGAIGAIQFSASTGNLTAGTFVQQALRP